MRKLTSRGGTRSWLRNNLRRRPRKIVPPVSRISANPKTKPRTVRPSPSPWIDLASIWVVQLARRARERVWALVRTQLKIVAIVACRGAEAKARKAYPAGDAPLPSLAFRPPRRRPAHHRSRRSDGDAGDRQSAPKEQGFTVVRRRYSSSAPYLGRAVTAGSPRTSRRQSIPQEPSSTPLRRLHHAARSPHRKSFMSFETDSQPAGRAIERNEK